MSLAIPGEPSPMVGGPFAPRTAASPPVQQALLYTGLPPMGMSEVLIVTPHHPEMTHLDAPAHMPVDGQVYPGRPLTEAVTPAGVQQGSTTAFAHGLITRAELLDLAPGDRLPAGYQITGADLAAAVQRTGTSLESGDAVVVRAGWRVSWDASTPTPGLTLDAVHWLHRHDVSVYVGDIGDAFPPLGPTLPMPLHMIGLAHLGMPLIDNAAVDELAAVCADLNRHAFMLTVSPPRFHGATGVPVNPIAVF